MKFNFDWDFVPAGAPYITVSNLGLAFNTPSINLLGSPDRIVVGFDEESMTIGVRKANEAEQEKAYLFDSRIKNGWIRIGCKEFVKYLASISGISFSPAVRYIAKFDKDEAILYITITEQDDDKGENVDEN
jgi:hypothetical protein